MIAKNDADLLDASETLFTLNADYMVRKQCEARADYYRLQNTIHKKMSDLTSEIENLNSQNQVLTSKNQVLNSKVDNLIQANTEKDILIAQLKAQLAEK